MVVFLQDTYPHDSLSQHEETPLISPSYGDSGNYGSHAVFEESTDKEYERERQREEERKKGRYTPVSNAFSEVTDKQRKKAFELPHKDYDVSCLCVCFVCVSVCWSSMYVGVASMLE